VKYPDARLLILSKAPDAGVVKTRLIPLLGAAGAAGFYADLLHTCIDRLGAAELCPVDLWCWPSTRHPFFTGCAQHYGVTLQQQPAGDIGQRMEHALGQTLQQCGYAVLVGADCPDLAITDIEAALQALQEGADVVLGPALDGGYYLVAMRERHAFLFEDMPWGSADVLRLTESRLRAHGLRWLRLTRRRDLDTPEDYVEWKAAD
jgi:hypothetical protein